MLPHWDFVLTDSFYVPIGQLVNADGRSVALKHNGFPTFNFTVRLDNPLTYALSGAGGYIKGYRNGVLEYFGPIISAEETADSQTKSLAVVSSGVGWFLQKRLAGKSADGTAFTTTDRAQIIKALLDAINAESETGIATSDIVADVSPYVPPGSGNSLVFGSTASRPVSGLGTPNITAASASSYKAGPYKPLYDCMRELWPGTEGFDWQIVPYDNYTTGIVDSQKIGQFRAYPLIGQQQPEAIFEFGQGRNNVMSYRRTISRETQANQVYHNVSDGPDAPGYPTQSKFDAASILAYRMVEDIAQADVKDLVIRQRLLDEHLRVRAYPRQVVDFQPHLQDGTGRVPDWRTEYMLGDQVRARIKTGGQVTLDAWCRVYGVTFEIDKQGMERVSLTLAEES